MRKSHAGEMCVSACRCLMGLHHPTGGMFDGFAPPYTLEQLVNYNPHPTGFDLVWAGFNVTRKGYTETSTINPLKVSSDWLVERGNGTSDPWVSSTVRYPLHHETALPSNRGTVPCWTAFGREREERQVCGCRSGDNAAADPRAGRPRWSMKTPRCCRVIQNLIFNFIFIDLYGSLFYFHFIK